jgi:hypothetical protein
MVLRTGSPSVGCLRATKARTNESDETRQTCATPGTADQQKEPQVTATAEQVERTKRDGVNWSRPDLGPVRPGRGRPGSNNTAQESA